MFFPFNFIVKRGKGSAGTAWGQRGHYNNPTVWQYPTETQIQSNPCEMAFGIPRNS